MQSSIKNTNKHWKDCPEGQHKEIDTQNGRINQQQVWSISYLKFQNDTLIILSVSTRNPPRRVLSNFQSKKNKGFPCLTGKYEGLEIPLNLSLYWKSAAISSWYIIDGHHLTLEEEKLIVIVIIKASSLDIFIIKIISNDFWTYCSSGLKSCSVSEATISF